jgi:leucyl-tRNA synthetase
MDTYDAQAIERRWQQAWADAHAFETPNPDDPAADRSRKSYVLEMLPYPSGTLHMGHMLVYTLGDVVTHFRRRNGLQVLRPMGWDSFGLPAENAAIKEGGHPREIVERNIRAIRSTMQRVGWAIDWTREFGTHEPAYYRWTQWLFLQLYGAGLAYRKKAPVKWCPNDQTVLANEQVKDGRCERCGAEVISVDLEQWFFRTTQYADALLDEMAELDWPERILAMQRHWIGRSHGAEVAFRCDELDADVRVFTTRPDTLYGATFFVLAPEHPLVETIAARSPHGDEIRAYVQRAAAKRAEERAAATEKSGVFTGLFVTNPVNEARLPIWISDYVLMDYGTGAIMAVPAHDERDLEFARTFSLPVKTVVGEDGVLVESAQFSGLPADEAKRAIVEMLAERGRGEPAVNYRLRDWGFSRQRYWGSPIPIVYCNACGMVPVPDEELPVLRPAIEEYLR